jgi:hypothetical protein
MKTLRTLLNWFHIPALVLHELSHLVFELIFVREVEFIDIILKENYLTKKSFFYINGMVNSAKYPKKYFVMILLTLSPLVYIFLYIGLAFVNPYFLIGLAYYILSYKFSLPSKGDLFELKIYKELREHNFDDNKKIELYEREYGKIPEEPEDMLERMEELSKLFDEIEEGKDIK